MTLVMKPSRAKQLWLAVLVVVLACMYYQTSHHHGSDYNFLVHANSDANGARVFIDGQDCGVLTTSDHADMSGTNFRNWLSHGWHVVEVRKTGFKPFKKRFSMGMEGFVGVDLVPQSTN